MKMMEPKPQPVLSSAKALEAEAKNKTKDKAAFFMILYPFLSADFKMYVKKPLFANKKP